MPGVHNENILACEKQSPTDHYYVENGRVFLTWCNRNGHQLAMPSSYFLDDIEALAKNGVLIEKELPEDHARAISNNRKNMYDIKYAGGVP